MSITPHHRSCDALAQAKTADDLFLNKEDKIGLSSPLEKLGEIIAWLLSSQAVVDEEEAAKKEAVQNIVKQAGEDVENKILFYRTEDGAQPYIRFFENVHRLYPSIAIDQYKTNINISLYVFQVGVIDNAIIAKREAYLAAVNMISKQKPDMPLDEVQTTAQAAFEAYFENQATFLTNDPYRLHGRFTEIRTAHMQFSQ